MTKFRSLKGIANNLADSFISPTNLDFVHLVGSLYPEDAKLIKINLLKETITPGELKKSCKNILSYYKKWFVEEIKKLDISLEDLEDVTLKISSHGSYFTCNVLIKAKNKEYSAKSLQSYS